MRCGGSAVHASTSSARIEGRRRVFFLRLKEDSDILSPVMKVALGASPTPPGRPHHQDTESLGGTGRWPVRIEHYEHSRFAMRNALPPYVPHSSRRNSQAVSDSKSWTGEGYFLPTLDCVCRADAVRLVFFLNRLEVVDQLPD